MKKLIIHKILFLTAISLLLLNSCSKTEDYSHLVYKNYLTYEISRADNFLGTTVEGAMEGEYKSGSKQEYQVVIDNAQLIDENSAAQQKEIDEAYTSLLLAGEDFFDNMVPFRSAFQIWIDYGDHVIAYTDEGDQEGDVKPGNKELLQTALNNAEQTVELEDLTQGNLDLATIDLTESIYLFNNEIIGRADLLVINPGFEQPGYDTEDFNEVEGWSLFGNVEDWAPLASVVTIESAPEGAFVAKIGSYTQGTYQNFAELINPNADYTLSFKVSLQSNDTDWEGTHFPAILLTRIIVFEQEEGDYNFITILSESYDTLGIDPGDYIDLNQTVSIDAISASIGKNVAVDFLQRHTWDAAIPIWAESFVALDDIHLYRKL